jgi:putative AlgH/UPF0301 family transcriptional regulator
VEKVIFLLEHDEKCGGKLGMVINTSVGTKLSVN